jgi:signal transduction histidine kinase
MANMARLERTVRSLLRCHDPAAILRSVAEIGAEAADLCVVQHIDHAGRLLGTAVDLARTAPDGCRALRDELLASRCVLAADRLDGVTMVNGDDLETLAGDAGDSLQALGMQQGMVAPLVAGEERVGVVGLFARSPEAMPDRSALLQLLDDAAHALANAREVERLTRALDSRTDLLATTCHDLATPLGAIRVGLELLGRQMHLRDLRHAGERLEQLVETADRLLRLLRALSECCAVEEGQVRLDVTRCSVRELIDTLVAQMRPLAGERRLFLRRRLRYAGTVLCDRDRTLDVLTNLVGNAIKFTRRGGVTISVQEDREQVRFVVEDTGPGIPPELLPFIFDRYVRAGRPSSRGQGLGLYIVRTLVEAQRGALSVESQVGLGSRFAFTLPRTTTAAASAGPAMDGQN